MATRSVGASFLALASLLALVRAVACSESDTPAASPASGGAVTSPEPAPAGAAPQSPAPPSAEDAIAAGRQIYLGNCIACHNIDPKLDGALGPAVAGSSAELIEARVLRGEYPPGYTPKRDTRAMVAMPFLESKLPALIAYLDSER